MRALWCLVFGDEGVEVLVRGGEVRVFLENLVGEGAGFADEFGVGDEVGEAEVG